MAPIDLPAARERGTVPRPLRWSALALPVALLDGATILTSALLVGRLYYTAAFGNAGSLAGHLGWGTSIGLIFVATAAMRGDYRFDRYLVAPSRPAGLWLSWTIAFAAVLALMFLLKSSEEMSRGATLLLYGVGLGILVAQRFAMARLLDGLRRNGHLASGRWLIIGHDDAIAACLAGFPPGARQAPAVSCLKLDGLDDPAGAALAAARRTAPDRILIAVPWTQMPLIERLADALIVTPAAIALAPESGLARFPALAGTQGVTLVRAPLGAAERMMKRGFDIVVASLALLLLSPLLVAVAAMIRRDSPGPALFRQTRHGFNQTTFRVFKFRTMSVMEDGQAFRQATRGDARVTRIGRILRRTNIDELPQLLNVLSGDMSIVGPRPHPVALNESFDSRIARYSRRHAVKPGITGWAQVHGLRGETDTEEKMRARVRYDLAYLENWSLLLDMRIMLMTLFSRSSYDNAC